MMPTYNYQCMSCEHNFTDFKMKIAQRNDPTECPKCGSTNSEKRPNVVHFDYRMGLDPDGFPTMGDKWAKIQESKNRPNGGKKGWDSNNNAYGGEHER